MSNTIFYTSIIIIIVLVAIGIFLPKVLKINEFVPIEAGKSAVLSLESGQNHYAADEAIIINLYLESEQTFDGVDVLLKYEPQYLDIETDINGENFFLDADSSIFKNFVKPKIDKEKGEIKFSALIENGAGFSGRVKVASLNFLAKQKGETKIEIVFQKGDIFDSNVSSFEKEEDILGKVENISISIE